MLNVFNRKKKAIQEAPQTEVRKPCDIFGHTWRDFPAYMEYQYEEGKFLIEIKEPYVCTICHTRSDVVLCKQTGSGTYKEFTEIFEAIKKENKEITKPKAIVNDMVNDAIRVDRLKIECWDKLHAIEGDKEDGQVQRDGRK